MIEIAYENKETVKTKQCTKCKEIKPLTDFWREKRRQDGLSSQCGKCRRQGYIPKPNTVTKRKLKEGLKLKGLRKCPKCKKVKTLIEFSKSSRYKDGCQNYCKKCITHYQQKNKQRIMAYNKKYRLENKEKKRVYNKQYREANKERIAKKNKQWYEMNKEKIKEYLLYNKEKIAEKARTHYRKTKNMFPKEFEEKYYCQKCGKELTIIQINCNQLYCSRKCCGLANRKPEAQVLRKYFRGYNWQFKRKIIRERDNYLCQICGEEENGLEHDVHHIVSWHNFSDKLEANNNSNLITLCQSCHRKHENDNSFIPIFLRIVEENEMFFLSKTKQSEMIES